MQGRPGRSLVEDRRSLTEMMVLSSRSACCGSVSVTYCTVTLILVTQELLLPGQVSQSLLPVLLVSGVAREAEHIVDGIAV